jgi:hypothetical protein
VFLVVPGDISVCCATRGGREVQGARSVASCQPSSSVVPSKIMTSREGVLEFSLGQ